MSRYVKTVAAADGSGGGGSDVGLTAAQACQYACKAVCDMFPNKPLLLLFASKIPPSSVSLAYLSLIKSINDIKLNLLFLGTLCKRDY